jgi:hypothetical protein
MPLGSRVTAVYSIVTLSRFRAGRNIDACAGGLPIWLPVDGALPQ